MQSVLPRVRPVALPPESAVGSFYGRTDLADAYAASLPPDVQRDPERLARAIFEQTRPAWITGLMGLRDLLVTGFGLKTVGSLTRDGASKADRISMFRIYSTSPHEIILGEDDKHLDFRISVLFRDGRNGQGPSVVVSTVVQCHNLLGTIYLMAVGPFHRLIVPLTLRRAARAGWPSTAGAAAGDAS